jgi:hypothetical protein
MHEKLYFVVTVIELCIVGRLVLGTTRARAMASTAMHWGESEWQISHEEVPLDPTVYSVNGDTSKILQQMAVPKARTRKLPFWAVSDGHDRITYISMGSAQIEFKCS